MTLTDLQPFTAALQAHAGKSVLPTALTSREIQQQLDAGTRRRSFFSAQTLFTDYLDQVKADVESIINPVTTQRADRVTPENPQGNVTVGLDPATARLRAKELLQRIGYAPAIGEAGTIKDLSSDARINLVLKTNRDIAQGAGWFIQGNDPAALDAFPAQELTRVESRKTQRDWQSRWTVAASAAGDTDAIRVLESDGRMIARKDSPIWDELGNPDNFDDALGNPFPPFAFGSGMDVRDISYTEAVELELIQPGEAVRPQLPADLGELLEAAA